MRARKIPEEYWNKFFGAVMPQSFVGQESKDMLSYTKYLLDDGICAINERFTKLLTALRTATATEYKLEKELLLMMIF